MLCIRLKSRNPYVCLATEEYLMKEFSEDIFMLWQSDDTVVIGKHQNAMGEINYRYVHENNIQVARRISGGGTVFHDAGNLNFAYIKNVDSPSEISFARFVQPMVEALAKLGVKATTSGRNDLLADGKKISGNAQHIFKNRVLHHGTLLFDSNLETLGNSIKVIPGRYQGKAVQSNRSIVTNILPYLSEKMTLETFAEFMLNNELSKSDNIQYHLNDDDKQAVKVLVEEKFTTWDWNYGYSPKYSFEKTSIVDEKQVILKLKVEKGYIGEALVAGNYFTTPVAAHIETRLQGKRHFHNDVQQTLLEKIPDATDELIFAFF